MADLTVPLEISVDDLMGVITGADQAALDAGMLDGDEVWYEFHTQQDDRVRPSHAALDGSVWRVGDPDAPVPPLDYGCFLPGTKISGVIDGASRAFYDGKAVEIITQSGRRLRVTPNHPTLTDRGLIPAGEITDSDKVLVHDAEIIGRPLGEVDKHNPPAGVEQALHALLGLGAPLFAESAAHYFHGDGKAIKGKIQIVGTYADLWRMRYPDACQMRRDGHFHCAHTPSVLPHAGLGEHGGKARLSALELDGRCAVRGSHLSDSLIGGHAAPLDPLLFGLRSETDATAQQLDDNGPRDSMFLGYGVDGVPIVVPGDKPLDVKLREMGALCLGSRPHGDACLYQPLADVLSVNPAFSSDLIAANPTSVSFDQVVGVRVFDYIGHVYDFRSPYGYIIANGIATSNCRCFVTYCAPPASNLRGQLPPAPDAEPVPVAELYGDALDEAVPNWRDKWRSKWSKLAPADKLNGIYLDLRDMGISDAREIASMIDTAAP